MAKWKFQPNAKIYIYALGMVLYQVLFRVEFDDMFIPTEGMERKAYFLIFLFFSKVIIDEGGKGVGQHLAGANNRTHSQF